MADSNPAKRRRISPSDEAPVDAPRSPSKIPIPASQLSQDGTRSSSMPRRPSFASPTKASLARHNPQVLPRTGTSARHEPVNTDKKSGTAGTKASSENATGDREIAGGSRALPQTPDQGNHEAAKDGLGNNPGQGAPSITGFLASAPRRRSRTPGKPPETGDWSSHVERRIEEELLPGPIRRSALRRSPPAGSQSQTESQSHSQPQRYSPTENPDTGTAANIGIVRKPALRRSPPTASQHTTQSQTHSQRSAEKMNVALAPARNSALRRSPPQISSQTPDQMPAQPENTQSQMESQPKAQSKPQLPAQPEPEVQETVRHTPTHQRHREPTDISGQDQGRNDEPELPPTPVQLGLKDPIVTTPPTGIHDTPSKRRTKKQDRSMAQVAGSQHSPSKPSPLKKQSHLQSFSTSMAPKPLPKKTNARSITAGPNASADVPSQDEDVGMTGVSRHGPRPPPDMHAKKRKLRDQLFQELQDLQADISLAESENERLHYMHESGSSVGIVTPSRSKIEELLKRSGYGDDKDEQEMPKKLLNSFHALSSFLPFSAPLTHQPPPVTTQDEDPVPTHHPLEQDDPLPYLQVFTPLQFSSVITIIPSSADPDTSLVSTSTSSSTEVLKDIIQSHTITARSPTSASLFKSTVTILVNTTTFSIISIKINSLSPMAQPELGSFLAKIADANDDDVLVGNVATLFWSVGRWYEVAKRRAVFWVRVNEEFGPESEFATRTRGTNRTTIAKKRGRKRKDARSEALENDGNHRLADAETAEEDEAAYRKLTRKEYLSNMGRQSTILTIPISPQSTTTIDLRVEWKISFDWTGETENSISVGVIGGKAGGWPGSWRKQDTRKSLDKFPATFERMVRERGPLNAVRGVVELLGGSES